MDNNNVKNTTPTDNNEKAPKLKNNKPAFIAAIAAIAVVVVILVLGIFVFKWFSCSSNNTADNKNNKQSQAATNNLTPETINITKQTGDGTKTTKAKISVRDVKFGSSIKKVKRFEKTQEDTLDNPSEATSDDKYTYLTYNYSPKAEFFGVKPASVKHGAILQYVFKKKKLFSINIQYGDIKKSNIKKLEKNLKDSFGKNTQYVKYSNNSYILYWRTAAKDPKKQTLLSLNYSPLSGTTVCYEKVKR